MIDVWRKLAIFLLETLKFQYNCSNSCRLSDCFFSFCPKKMPENGIFSLILSFFLDFPVS